MTSVPRILRLRSSQRSLMGEGGDSDPRAQAIPLTGILRLTVPSFLSPVTLGILIGKSLLEEYDSVAAVSRRSSPARRGARLILSATLTVPSRPGRAVAIPTRVLHYSRTGLGAAADSTRDLRRDADWACTLCESLHGPYFQREGA